jgi:hypothetical protein
MAPLKQNMQNNEFIVNDLNNAGFRGQALDVKINQSGSIDEIPFSEQMVAYRIVKSKLSAYDDMKVDLDQQWQFS